MSCSLKRPFQQWLNKKRILHSSGPPIAWEEMCGPAKGAIIGAMLYEGFGPPASKTLKTR
ncbi:MAG: hypothetical protein ACLR31_02585 [Escherichia coli]